MKFVLKHFVRGACPRWRSARTCPLALCRLDPEKCLPAREGVAWRLPPHCAAPPGVLSRSAAGGSGLCRSREESWARPWSRGGAAERRRRRPGPQDRPLPGGPSKRGAVELKAWGLSLGPTAAGLRRGSQRLESCRRRTEGYGPSVFCDYTQAPRGALSHHDCALSAAQQFFSSTSLERLTNCQHM
ncbi:hypothetical protein NDU88_001780 [Pleurodeles waltl]|uniref:Uncharacterized protein n=1 Tax=Pleurodeles waltl TaxID=8319 RepID=A0AAV7VXG7_PLEWA|nr:hypothetical protein NDU88_001780 [Pleurodeles waltl]